MVLPFGAMALVLVDPLSLRWFVAGLLVSLITGWRYHGRPTFAASLGVGAHAGFGGGAVQIGAPPLLVFWLGGNNNSVTVCANIMVYFIMQGALSIVMYFLQRLVQRAGDHVAPWPAAPTGSTALATRSIAAPLI